MSGDLVSEAIFNLRSEGWNDEADAIVDRLQALEHTLARVAAVLRLSLKYNTAMHGGAAAHNQRLQDTVAEIERLGVTK
jgi:hypothetical protein